MVDYVEAIKRPFTDIGKLILGTVLGMIPIINLIVIGYFLDVAKTAMNKDMKMPEFKDFGNLFINGLLAFIIALIYGLIYIIPVLILVALIVMDIFPSDTFLKVVTFSIFLIVILAISIPFLLISSVAILRFAETREFGTAFEFGEIAKKAFTKTYVIGFIISTVISAGLGIITSSIIIFIGMAINPLIIEFPIGGLIIFFVDGVISRTILGQAYSEA